MFIAWLDKTWDFEKKTTGIGSQRNSQNADDACQVVEAAATGRVFFDGLCELQQVTAARIALAGLSSKIVSVIMSRNRTRRTFLILMLR